MLVVFSNELGLLEGVGPADFTRGGQGAGSWKEACKRETSREREQSGDSGGLYVGGDQARGGFRSRR